MTPTRRTLLGGAAAVAGLGVLGFVVAGEVREMTPAAARADKVPLRTLTDAEANSLEAFGEVLLPGARAAGIAHFVDHHLSVAPAQSLLMLRYLDVAPPYAPFYKAGLAALEALSEARHGTGFAGLDAAQATALVGEMAKPGPPMPGWQGPPPSLFYFAARADAVDVVYGTEAGFEKLGVPYMAHLLPETPW